ncbi:hypothetical protein COBT_003496 [Conglomerata obtusa]
MDDLVAGNIENCNTILYHLNYKEGQENLQYYIFIPIKDQKLMQYVLYSDDFVFLQNQIDLVIEDYKYNTSIYKEFYRKVLLELFLLNNEIYTIKLLQFGTDNFNFKIENLDFIMFKYISMIPKFPNISFCDHEGEKIDLMMINNRSRGGAGGRIVHNFLLSHLGKYETVTNLRILLIKLIKEIYIKCCKIKYVKDYKNEYMFMLYDNSLNHNEEIRSKILSILRSTDTLNL